MCLNTIKEVSGVNKAVDMSRVVILATITRLGKANQSTEEFSVEIASLIA